MHGTKGLLVGLALCAAGASASGAIVNTENYITVESSAAQIGNGLWRYNYTLSNAPTSPGSIAFVSIAFFSDVDLSCNRFTSHGWDCEASNIVGNFGPTSILWHNFVHEPMFIHPGETMDGFTYDSSYAPIKYPDRLVTGLYRTGIDARLDVLGPGSPLAIAAFGVPEPSTLLLAVAALAGMGWRRRHLSRTPE